MLKQRQFIVPIHWYWTVLVKFFLLPFFTFTSVFLREHWPVIAQEDTFFYPELP